MQIPDCDQGNDEHHHIREDVDDGSGDEKGVGVDASLPGNFLLAGALEKHDKNQRNAVQQIKQYDPPDGIVHSRFPRLRRDEYTME